MTSRAKLHRRRAELITERQARREAENRAHTTVSAFQGAIAEAHSFIQRTYVGGEWLIKQVVAILNLLRRLAPEAVARNRVRVTEGRINGFIDVLFGEPVEDQGIGEPPVELEAVVMGWKVTSLPEYQTGRHMPTSLEINLNLMLPADLTEERQAVEKMVMRLQHDQYVKICASDRKV